MSRATREARTKLACAVGALIVIKDNDLATPENRTKLYTGILLGGQVLQQYPDTGDQYKNDVWCKKVLRSMDQDIDMLGIYTFKTLMWLAHLLVVDLLEMTNNPETKKILQPFHDLIMEVSQDILEGHVDIFYDKANTLVNRLYQQLGYFEAQR